MFEFCKLVSRWKRKKLARVLKGEKMVQPRCNWVLKKIKSYPSAIQTPGHNHQTSDSAVWGGARGPAFLHGSQGIGCSARGGAHSPRGKGGWRKHHTVHHGSETMAN